MVVIGKSRTKKSPERLRTSLEPFTKGRLFVLGELDHLQVDFFHQIARQGLSEFTVDSVELLEEPAVIDKVLLPFEMGGMVLYRFQGILNNGASRNIKIGINHTVNLFVQREPQSRNRVLQGLKRPPKPRFFVLEPRRRLPDLLHVLV